MIKRRWLVGALLLVAMVVSACGGAQTPAQSSTQTAPAAPAAPVAQAPKEKKKLQIGYLNVMDDAQAMLAKDGGFYEKHGLDVELKLFSSGTDLIKAIVAGQLHAGVLGFTNAVSWADKGADLKVVGGAQMGYHSILVKKGSSIKTVADLKGKKLASQQKGSTADIVLNGVVFPQAGLTPKDVNMVYVDPAVAVTSLKAGQVDAAFVFEPYESIASATTEVDAIYEIGKVWPFPCMVVITSGKQLSEDREAIDRVLDAQREAMVLMQKQPKQAAQFIWKRFVQEDTLTSPSGAKVPAVDVIQKAIESQMFHWDINDTEIKRMDEVITIMANQGLIQKKLDVNTILDLTWQKKQPAHSH